MLAIVASLASSARIPQGQLYLTIFSGDASADVADLHRNQLPRFRSLEVAAAEEGGLGQTTGIKVLLLRTPTPLFSETTRNGRDLVWEPWVDSTLRSSTCRTASDPPMTPKRRRTLFPLNSA